MKRKTLNTNQLQMIYNISDDVYNGKLRRVEGVNILAENIKEHKSGSHGMYIDDYKYLRDAIPYGRNMGKDILDCFLRNITNEYGLDALRNALISTYKHIINYYNKTQIKQNSDRKIGAFYADKYNIDLDFSERIFENIYDDNEEVYINLVNINSNLSDSSGKYLTKPKKIITSSRYERNIKTSVSALKAAGYRCELNNNHVTFIRKTNNQPYTEPHHLVPMKYQKQFKVDLDVENNIVSLCSTCHNKLHYGKNFEKDLKTLYENHKHLLEMAGIYITFQELLSMYD